VCLWLRCHCVVFNAAQRGPDPTGLSGHVKSLAEGGRHSCLFWAWVGSAVNSLDGLGLGGLGLSFGVPTFNPCLVRGRKRQSLLEWPTSNERVWEIWTRSFRSSACERDTSHGSPPPQSQKLPEYWKATVRLRQRQNKFQPGAGDHNNRTWEACEAAWGLYTASGQNSNTTFSIANGTQTSRYVTENQLQDKTKRTNE
jgi:hypothetical protein